MEILADLAGVLRWQDAVDVAILTFILFRIYLWLRGTVALQVLIGMLMLLGAGFLAAEAGLMLTAYVLQALGAVVTLVAVIIFREEIRHALRRANPMRWLRRSKDDGDRGGQFRELVQAAFALADKRIGALLVVPSSEPVKDHLTGGTEVGARVSSPVLEAIFHAGSPIHDGAAVIEDGRISLAGAFLPLTTAGDLPKHLGTRHRAALGLSEECDALVLVVSEERGTVSLVKGGALRVTGSPRELEDRIEDALRQAGAPAPRRASTMGWSGALPPPRRRLVDLAWLLGILVFVTGAWYHVVGDRNTVITREVPIELRHMPGELDVDSQPAQVKLRLQGPRKLLLTTGPEQIETWVNLTGMESGHHKLKVSVSTPTGIQVEKVEPAEVYVKARPKAKAVKPKPPAKR